jgi:PucR family transcriptional regulator, purine catabolism regulatory protein
VENVPILVRDLLRLPGLGLELVAGGEGLDRPLRWAHSSELADPTPWLSGGELLLTTGMTLKDAGDQRAYVDRLAKAGAAGLGFGVGFNYEAVPEALIEAADAAGFPLLEVPFPVPFIAITEAISSRLAEDRLRDAQMSVEVHERLASLIVEGAGLADVLDEVVELAGGWALLFDLRGELVARSGEASSGVPTPEEVWAGLPPGLTDRFGPRTSAEAGPHGTRVALAVLAGKRHEAVLVFGKDRRLAQRDRIVVHHAVTVVALLLAARRAVIQAERRIAGDVLGEAFSGRLSGADLERRLDLVGFPPESRITALVVEARVTADGLLEDLAWAVDETLGRRTRRARAATIASRVGAIVADDDPEALARALMDELNESSAALGIVPGSLRLGVGETVDPAAIRRSYLAAVFALRAAPAGSAVGLPRDLGSYGFLLGSQPRPALEGYVRSVLGSLIDRDRNRSSELVPSVSAFIAAGGRWEQGAEALGVHRHTLRYRVRQAEDLLGRDLSSAEDRLEVWLALKAAEILEE